MWKSLSFKSQVFLILLIPISGLIYITISNINSSLKEYKNINSSIEKIDNIAFLSEGISLISNERSLNNYSHFDASKKYLFLGEQQKTYNWFLKSSIKENIISKNLKSLQASLLNLESDIDNKKETPTIAIVKYTRIIEILNHLIEREVVDCESLKLSDLATNYNTYILFKEVVLLKRVIALQALVDDVHKNNLDKSLLELSIKAKSYEEVINFKLDNSRFDNLNSDLIKYKNSTIISSFNIDSESIIEDKLNMTPNLWWEKTDIIIARFEKLEKNNLTFITNEAKNEKQTIFNSVRLLILLLSLFLIVTIFLLYKLIKNLSSSLHFLSTSIKKISQGEIIENPDFSGNSEFIDINNSFNQLLNGIKEQFDLSKKISTGDYGSEVNLRSPNDILNKSLNSMSTQLSRLHKESEETSLMEKNIIEVNKSIVESKDLKEFGANICQTIAKQTKGCQSSFYIIDTNENINQLRKIGGYADDDNTPKLISIGEGIVGEVAKRNRQKCLNNLTNHYSYISSSLGKSPYYNVLITPISFKNVVIGVIEVGSLENFSIIHEKLLTTISDSIGSAIEVFISNEELKISVGEINRKNNILQVQEEELRQSNEELNKQTLLLQQSEEELRNQAAELEQTNAYLEEKGRELENKNYEVGVKNDELVIAQEELNIKAEEIAQASKYKSEFLANMSHELRTPLNSILILSDLLKENTQGNLSEAQIDNLSVINSSGKDLLNLITDILDISKIEAGKVEVYPEETIVERIYSDMDGLFNAQMLKKNIEFTITISDDCPRMLFTDIGKVEQILKNFLSNALKFTPENGKIFLLFSSGKGKNEFASPSLSKLNSKEILSIHIEDNGIGISKENMKKLFQTFQQADGSTSRKYGGTGLGLYISKELAILLGGEVDFQSELNEGSTFSVYLPAIFQVNESQQHKVASISNEIKPLMTEEIAKPSDDILDLTDNSKDDRNQVTPDDRTILIIEDDASFADVLLQVAHENGFKAIVAYQGETGFQYAKKYKPKAIILDMKLPGIDGWTVLKWLKDDKELQHIPVHVMSGMDRGKLAKELGAFDFLVKPITTEKLKSAFESIDIQISKVFKKILILEDDVNLNYSIKELVHNCDRNVICIQAHTFKEAEYILKNDDIDCAIMDIGLPDSKGVENISVLKKISKNQDINIIVNTGQSLSEEDELELRNSAKGIVVKTNNATDRLKDELLLFLDSVETSDKKTYKSSDNLLGGGVLMKKTILIVDDDIRNIYALSSALTTKGASILTAFNGIEALEVLEKNSNIDIVLMDIMMPEMDGYEATRKIRENSKWKNLPIIALTAKAMKGDREEILEAGASDYQSKPIDIQQLISLISIWIYK